MAFSDQCSRLQRPAQGYAIAFSRGIRKLGNIQQFLGVEAVLSPAQAGRQSQKAECLVVWGRKQNTQKALRYAANHDLKVVFVEDGWIRSCATDPHSRICYSLLVDDVGVHYDSTAPSALENLLNLPDELFAAQCNDEQLTYAAECRRLLVHHEVSKYNFCAAVSSDELHKDDRDLIIVLDQTVGDASVRLGGMTSSSFKAMLDRALSENPQARVVLRTHPDVVIGKKQGYLCQYAAKLGVEISCAGDNPIPWMKRASRVYAGTSQLGYEALICGCSVTVAGKPFYSGWGLTDDLQALPRRIQSRSLDELFHATHVAYARYCCPVTSQPWTLRQCLEHVRVQKSYFRRNARDHVCLGITPWKQRVLRQFLRSPEGPVRFSSEKITCDTHYTVQWSFTDLATPAMLAGEASPAQANAQNRTPQKTVRIEDGFIRSVGLGSDYVLPNSLVFDDVGLYFDATRSSALENLLNEYICTAEELEESRLLRTAIVDANLSKYNLDHGVQPVSVDQSMNKNAMRLLVIGQVEGDQSIVRGAIGSIRSNTELLQRVRETHPDATIIYKPHPDVISGNRKGAVDEEVLSLCTDEIMTSGHFPDCLDAIDELHTMTSLSGFEALLRNKVVVTYGMPFYAGWGLTKDQMVCARRIRKRTLDELIYLCLIKYPHYLDLESGEFMSPLQMVQKMQSVNTQQTRQHTIPRWLGHKALTQISNVIDALTYSP